MQAQNDTQKTTEAYAAKIALSGSAIERARLGARALYDLIKDPDDTTRVFVLGLLVSRRSYPHLLARITTDDRGARLLRERPAIDKAHVDFDMLRALPATTLGGAYVRYLDAKNLDPDLFQEPPGLPEVPGYIAKRMRQVHDVWHVLTGYDTDVRGELALQAFTWAQTDSPSAMLVTFGGLARFGVGDRGLFVRVIDAYRRGRKAEFLAPLWLEEMWERPLEDVRAELGIVARDGGIDVPGQREDVDVAIVGSGFSGIAVAHLLREAGVTSFVILEKGDDVGGTWRENTYPGAACDIPSHLYSFSFEPNPRWTRAYSPQREILDYLKRTAEKYAITPHIRFGSHVERCEWDEARGSWSITTKDGHALRARSLVLGNGALHLPQLPQIEGRDTFAGPAFHTARWDASFDPRGKRIAVVGTGASAIQTVPALAGIAARIDVHQRTPAWVVPRNNHPYGERTQQLFSRHPRAQKLLRAAIYARAEATAIAFLEPRAMAPLEFLAKQHIARQVKDTALREKLTPRYRMGCKRILVSDDYYPALCRDDVDVITTPIDRVEAKGIRTSDGTLREVDAIVWATGFDVAGYLTPIAIHGRDGKSLQETWSQAPSAYLGISVAGFPNLFTMMGPNTGLGHNSMIFMIEAQARYAVQAITALRDQKLRALDVRPEAQRAFTAELDRKMSKTVWMSGCHSWYLAGGGTRNSTLWPGYTFDYWWQTRKLDLSAYEKTGQAARTNPPPITARA